jgi:hypothetical protein
MRKIILAGSVAAGAAAGIAAARRQRATHAPAREPRFDPDAVARLEVAGWRAYYDRDFLKGAVILFRLLRGQVAATPLGALRASYFALRGQMAFAGERGDRQRALDWMTRFYAAAPRRSGVAPEALAAAEIDYWVEHRRLVHQDDKAALTDALARLHALVFGGTLDAQRPSAAQRTLACNAVDRITGRRSTNPARDWALAEQHLRDGYRLAVAVGREAAEQPLPMSSTP